MASKIKPKRSYTTGAVPTTSDLDVNEIAISWADNKLFTKNSAGNIVSVTLGGGSYTLPTATGSVLGGIKVGANLTITDGVLAADVSGVVSSVAGRTGAVTLTSADVSGVAASSATGITGATAITNIVSLTQSSYDALGSKSATTLYIING
jgi:hypothetical protein